MLLFFFFCHVCGMWKFLGQESNLRHSSNNARSLTHEATKNSSIFKTGFPALALSAVGWGLLAQVRLSGPSWVRVPGLWEGSGTRALRRSAWRSGHG